MEHSMVSIKILPGISKQTGKSTLFNNKSVFLDISRRFPIIHKWLTVFSFHRIINESPENSKFDKIVQQPISCTTVLNSQRQL